MENEEKFTLKVDPLDWVTIFQFGKETKLTRLNDLFQWLERNQKYLSNVLPGVTFHEKKDGVYLLYYKDIRYLLESVFNLGKMVITDINR